MWKEEKVKSLLTQKNQKLLNELRSSHKWYCIEINSDYDYIWTMSLISAKTSNHEVNIVSYHEDLNKLVEEVYKKAKKFKK
jgi:hypothetical protein